MVFSAAGTFWPPSCGRPTSTRRRAVSRKLSGSCDSFAAAGHHPAQAAQDRCAGARHRPPHQIRHGFGLPSRGGVGACRKTVVVRRNGARAACLTRAAVARYHAASPQGLLRTKYSLPEQHSKPRSENDASCVADLGARCAQHSYRPSLRPVKIVQQCEKCRLEPSKAIGAGASPPKPHRSRREKCHDGPEPLLPGCSSQCLNLQGSLPEFSSRVLQDCHNGLCYLDRMGITSLAVRVRRDRGLEVSAGGKTATPHFDFD
jgi:hypothetical protein